MSGQPYRKATDIDKFRNQYMEALDLQAGINALNYEANMNFLQTGVLPPVSTMKDQRSVEDKLRDFEMLKQDISATIASVSSKQFGALVVQTILNSPLNVDNKLLVYTAQRIDDIIKQLSKIYKYGIRGDVNDAQQFVRFIEKMFTDTSAMTASTKEFMNRYSERSMLGSQYDQTRTKLTQVGARLQNIFNTLEDYIGIISGNLGRARYVGSDSLLSYLNLLQDNINTIISIIESILDSIPRTLEEVKFMEEGLLRSKAIDSDIEDLEIKYRAILDFINSGLPNVSSLSTMMERFNKYYINISKGIDRVIKEPFNTDISGLYITKVIIDTIKESIDYIMSMKSILQPLGDEYNIDKIKEIYTELARRSGRIFNQDYNRARQGLIDVGELPDLPIDIEEEPRQPPPQPQARPQQPQPVVRPVPIFESLGDSYRAIDESERVVGTGMKKRCKHKKY